MMRRAGPDIAVAVLLAVLTVAGVRLSDTLTDHFHEGEYVGVVPHMLAYYQGNAGFPLVIHGAMDYLPGLLGRALGGDDHVIVATRAVNAVISGINLAMFLILVNLVTARAGWSRPARFMLMALVTVLLFVPTGKALELHQRPLNPRDCFAVLMLAQLAVYERLSSRSAQMTMAALIGAGAALAPIWSYERGLVVLAAYAAACLGLILAKRGTDVIVSLGAGALALGVCQVTRIAGTLQENWHNAAYWVASADRWSSAEYPVSWLQAVVLIAATAGVTIALLRTAVAEWRAGHHVFAVSTAVLIVVLALYVRVSVTRADATHLFFAVWPALLGVVIACAASYRIDGGTGRIVDRHGTDGGAWLRRGGAIAMLVLMLAWIQMWGPLPHQLSAVELAKSLPRGLLYGRADRDLFDDPGFSSALAAFQSLEPHCILSWSNAGTVGLLTHKPYCADVLYPVYVRGAAEADYLARLLRQPPRAVIYNPRFWAHAIDGAAMEQRLPAVSAFIRDNYTVKAQFGDWIVLEHPAASGRE